jgi:hypothetical protein
MKKLTLLASLVLAAAVFVPATFAQHTSELNNPHTHLYPTKDRAAHSFAGNNGGGQNLIYWGGPVITNAHVVPIFWGPTWNASGTSDNITAASITKYIAAFGTTGEFNVITQYMVNTSNLAGGDKAFYDTSNPPTNVTDAIVQQEVSKYLQTHTYDPSAIYEVFLPSGSYSSNGTATSCGGPKLTYCAYHGNYSNGGLDVKYASMPYPSCGGCQSSGFNTTQNFEHFVSHETREAVTDPDLNAWFDRRGNEADDKCAWSPTPFTDSNTGTNNDGSAFAYQYEWSNASSSCVKTR